MVIKGYATLKFIYVLDNMFAAGLPPALTKNVEEINDTDKMQMQDHDHNSTWNVLNRYYKKIRVTFGCQKTGEEKLETTIGIVLEAKALENMAKANKIRQSVFERRKNDILKEYDEANEFA